MRSGNRHAGFFLLAIPATPGSPELKSHRMVLMTYSPTSAARTFLQEKVATIATVSINTIVNTTVSQRCVDLRRPIGHLLKMVRYVIAVSYATNEVLRYCYETSRKGLERSEAVFL